MSSDHFINNLIQKLNLIRIHEVEFVKKENGQYFTSNILLQQKIFEFILNKPTTILEPSVGRGDLIKFVFNKIPDIKFDMYEIDENIIPLDNIQKDKIIYADFIKQRINKRYKTIIGNPPYVRTKKGNLYIDFIDKCVNLLEDDGELIFIVPSDFFKLTSASKLLNEMLQNGVFTHIYHPHNEKMFENASIDILIFRYFKNRLMKKNVLYNDEKLYINNNNGLITFDKKQILNTDIFEDHFYICVGLVSGKEDIYKNEKLGNIHILNGKDKLDKYIFIEEFPSKNENINTYLLEHKKELIERKIRKFNENNWFEWGAPRNLNTIRKNMGKNCIYIYNLTRKKNVCFKDKVNYFGGGLIILIPKIDMNLDKIVSYINSDEFIKKFVFSGRFKIGHRQISNSNIPKKYLDFQI